MEMILLNSVLLATNAPVWQWSVVILLVIICVALAIADTVLLVKSKKTNQLPTENSEPQAEPSAENSAEAEPLQPIPEESALEEAVSQESLQEGTVTAEESVTEEPLQDETAEVAAEEIVADELVNEVAQEDKDAEEVVTEEEVVSEEAESLKDVPLEEELAVVASVDDTEEEEENDEEEEEDDEDDDFSLEDDEDVEEIESVISSEESASQESDAQINTKKGILPLVFVPAGERVKKIYVRYNFSFRAKLIQADREIQARYGEIADEINSYPKIKMSLSWKQVRIYSGRNTLAMLLFKGRKLCMTFALDPSDYENTKYKGKDVSEIKRFKKTPMLLKLTSARKVGYARYLFMKVAEKFGLVQGELIRTEFFLPYRSTEELIEQKLVKVLSSDPLQDDANVVMADIGTLIREQISLKEAREAMSDELAAELMEHETRGSLNEEEVSKAAVSRGDKKGIINIDTLSKHFNPDDTVTPEILKEMKLIPKNVGSLKILARGILDKPLNIEAQDFSMDAVKMILLTGGKAIKIL